MLCNQPVPMAFLISGIFDAQPNPAGRGFVRISKITAPLLLLTTSGQSKHYWAVLDGTLPADVIASDP